MPNQTQEIHPELQEISKYIPRINFSKKNLWLINALMRLMPSPLAVDGIRIENDFLEGQEDGARIRVRLYRPNSVCSPTPVLIWLHGGGYVTGRPEQDDEICVQFVQELGILVVSVDYRLAPKHPFPAGLEDSYDALKWTVSHSKELGIDPERIAIGGVSAGGGLAASLIQLAYDRKEINPVFQLLVYPMLDDRTVLRADVEDRHNKLWTQRSNRFGWESYLNQGCGADEVPSYAVPARRADLSGLPPAWIGVGTLDIFYKEDIAYAQRLKSSGVACEFDVIEGVFHGFDKTNSQLPVVRDFRGRQVEVLKKFLLGDS